MDIIYILNFISLSAVTITSGVIIGAGAREKNGRFIALGIINALGGLLLYFISVGLVK